MRQHCGLCGVVVLPPRQSAVKHDAAQLALIGTTRLYLTVLPQPPTAPSH